MAHQFEFGYNATANCVYVRHIWHGETHTIARFYADGRTAYPRLHGCSSTSAKACREYDLVAEARRVLEAIVTACACRG